MRDRRQSLGGVAAVVALAAAGLVAGPFTGTAHVAAVAPLPVVGPVKAFPGAEGFGTDTPGGRGGTVCKVTNLNDTGTGSLRACVSASGPRIVVFRVSGTITLSMRLEIVNPYLTIAGQTAPGDGITLRTVASYGKQTMLITTHDVVIRYLRFRPGHSDAPTDSRDALTIYKAGAYDVVIDHASLSWASDEILNTYDYSNRVTVSWSLVSEALNDTAHSKGLLSGGVGARNVSLHHNLIASNADRCPQISGVAVADLRNNVVYNCGNGSGKGLTLISSSKGRAQVNWVGNYYKPGPITPLSRAEFAMHEGDTGRSQQWYGDGNLRWTPTGDQPARVATGYAWGQIPTPFDAPPVTTTTAAQAYQDVLAEAGASCRRDPVDQRVVADVQAGTGTLINDPNQVGGYPTLTSEPPPQDTDGDAMPDTWETAHGTNPTVHDAAQDTDGNGYTNVEDWINGFCQQQQP